MCDEAEDRDERAGTKAHRPAASGLCPGHGVLQRRRSHARRRDLLRVSKIRTEFVAILAVSETTLCKRARG